ncbi:pentatricopeptide repeat-containing protein At1g55890, mitochondrial-like [Phoenix dactylifera]|uniref:Pentatricopeptide repeat-containing protein At1g55890, mitochondrial-like n=1 Tax=Phoenix dactylifera TaxID=42345 RepID=A0A8B9AQ87_PHODC|nr:pentatricopeptide repeat-containing protein At1g55890, mitochondrial-like [Phoenix dactylifera]XP_038987716.1 pentatricopeptide repeat-containing protein At1g55890, mitochondrial-like [Phoenix dactylifera]XP_038987717.1 pentatricopeptide repeat-containing protein At1g55890, mitochondrial-like [Phoenix dactylifera]
MSSRLVRVPQCLSRLFSSSGNPNPNPYPKRLKTTVNYLFREHNPDKLVAAFKKSSESYRFRCKHRIYEITVRRLAAAGRPDAVEAILEEQKRYPDDIAREGFAVRLISLYGKAGMPANAAATFDQLPALGCPRSVMSFNALLSACADAGDSDRMAAAFREIPAADPSIVPNVFSYNILIRVLCEKGDLDAAFNVLSLMENNEVAPDLISFNTLLNGFYSNKRFSDTEKIWTLMGEKNIEPDIKSFNAKLRALVSEGNTSEAVELVDELSRVGPKPDTFSFNALIKGHCQDGNLEEAKRLYLDLTNNGCAPNRGTFETLIPSLCEAGDLDLALKCCNESMSRRCVVDASMLQEVVEGLVKLSRVEEAKKLVELGRRNYYSRKDLGMPSPS